MSRSPPNSQSRPANASRPMMDGVRTRLGEDSFSDWHLIQERKRNEEEGYGDTRNDPSHTPADTDHSPSQIGTCHRMAYYDAQNTPREDTLPYGIFKFGHDFEAYAEQYLQEVVAGPTMDVRNVERIDFNIDGLRFVGSTDPVIFNEHGEPIALFEVKTSESLYYVRNDGEPKERHLAQAHAYSRGLQEKYDLDAPVPMFFIYGGREELDVVTFEESFDTEFWENTVVDWAAKQTEYREAGALPPTVDEEKDYMCGYCDYAERCGNYDPDSKGPNSDDYVENMDDYWWDDTIATSFQNTVTDMPTTGFLPLKEYPEDAVVAHLATYPDVELTPTLAAQYPHLVADSETSEEDRTRLERVFGTAPQRSVSDWVCSKCLGSFAFDRFNWDGDFDSLPTCPDCPDDPSLRGPKPGEIVL